ncbi:MAG: ribosomal protein [Bacteroidetes bacterium]|nr:ribosomal protein [Bacteroidota bacterium]
MEAVAMLRNNPSSPRKTRLVVDLIRGKKVEEALAILKFHKKESAGKLEKLVKSAINNWEQKNSLKPEDHELFIKSIQVNQGATIKRFLPAPQGRAYRLRKRSNHITIVVDSKVPVEFESAAEATEEAAG